MEKIDAATLAKVQEIMKMKLEDAEPIKPVFPLWAKDKINALKNLQIKITGIESKFFEEIQDLERKYMQIFNPLYDERMKIITGEKEKLTEEESKWNYEDETLYEQVSNEDSSPKNLPGFWLQALKATKMITDTK